VAPLELDLRLIGRTVAGLNPGCHVTKCNPGQVVYTRASVSKQYNLLPANGAVMLGSWVTAGMAESNGSLRRVYGYGHLRADC